MSKAAFGTRPSCARPTTRPLLQRGGSDHPSAKLFPLPRSGRQLSVYDPKTEKYTFIDTCYSTHHLQFAEDANDTLWTSGGGPVVGWLNSKMFLETGDAGALARLDGARARHERQRQARRVRRARSARRSDEGHARQQRLLRRDAESRRRLDLGLDDRLSRRRRARESRLESAGDGAHRGLHAADAGLRRSRRRHRSQRRRLDVAGQRPPGRVRSPQVQRPAERPDGDRQSLPRGLELPPLPGPRLRRPPRRERRVELLQLGRSAQHVGPGRERADVDGEPVRRRARARRTARW